MAGPLSADDLEGALAYAHAVTLEPSAWPTNESRMAQALLDAHRELDALRRSRACVRARTAHVSRFIAISTGGEYEVHASSEGFGGSYASLCGLDGADSRVGQLPASLPPNPKITCHDCLRLWRAWRGYTIRDFVAKTRDT